MSVLNFNAFFSYIKIIFKIWVILAGMILNQEAMICQVLLCKSTDAVHNIKAKYSSLFFQDFMAVLEAVLDVRTATIAFRPDSCGEQMET